VKTITDFDLNALQLLTVLDQTRHVGRAAEVLGMSQSGFSTALARLRRRLDDELFVRVSGSMQPTHRAVTLVQTAREILMQVETGILGKTDFAPRHARVEFRLSMSDVAEVVFLPKLLGHLAQHAPLATVHTSSPIGSSLRERMADGDVDLAIGYLPDLEIDSIFRQRLTSNTYACIVRSGHPVVVAGLSKAAYQELGHVVIATPAKSTSLLERTLERQRITRRIVLSTPHHLSLLAVISGSDLIATLPLGTALDFSRREGVEVLALPFRPPMFSVHQYWHRRAQSDPRNRWLREQFRQLFDQQNPLYKDWIRAFYSNLREVK